MSGSFDLIQKNFGFGFMRLPMLGEDVDIAQTCKMVDTFLENNCHVYLKKENEWQQ